MRRINFGSRPRGRKTFGEKMDDGGLFFYVVAGVAAAVLYGVFFGVMAFGTVAGF